ncbi:MAG: DivIVA domain-containing protein [Nitrospinota bacterium]|nr:DivIVA domain-containing protein [Nitrospinota bacterium]
MRLSYLDILEQCFHDKFRGYNKQEVDTFLHLIADDFKSMAEEIKEKDLLLKKLQDTNNQSETENNPFSQLTPEMLKEKAKKIVNTAKEKAEQHRQEAIKEVEGLIQDIEKLKKQKSSLMENIKSTAKDHLDKYKGETPKVRSGNAD